MRKKSHHIVFRNLGKWWIYGGIHEKIQKDKSEIVDFPSSIAIKAFRRGLLKHSNLFIELRKTFPYMMEETYKEEKMFINLEC